ncbi:PAS domain-containing protein [Halorussus sp. MSC15.2]|uniref:PAS domain-containing protein n=1 Tax=Halorussus sp. MSC15.2 TaxID=2283638 RepID=UPI0013D4C55A|nr:PAS domain-containing protein [Halorussus sp. MSC15.2]NEU55867.1 PAS domain-containing protein [Halorussus sp. MSC15.2]
MSRIAGGSIRVLHVDDEPAFADTAAEFLEREDDRFTVETASSAGAGVARLAEREFDCIVSDYDMPGKNGLEFLEAVRADHPDLPFILFTGKGSEEVASDAISAGVTDYLQKERGTDQYTVLANRVQNAVERTRAEWERQRQLDAIETAREGIGILDEDGHFLYVNEAYARLFGYQSEELLGEHWELIYPDEDVSRVREEILPTITETGSWQGTTTGRRADGSTFVANHTLATTDRGELICTVRKTSDCEGLQQKHELVVRASTDAFFDWDPETDEVTRNDEYLAQFGYDASDIESDTDWWRDRIHPDDRDRVFSAVERAVENPEISYDETYRFRKKDGTYGFLRTRGYVVYDEHDDPQRMVGVHIDVTDRKEHERDLNRLHDATSDLIQADTHEAIAETAVETVREVLDMPNNALWLHDETDDTLEPVALTDEAADLVGEPPVFEPGESLSWEVFQSQESEVFENVASQPGRHNPETPIRSEIILPLGDHGVMNIGSTAVGAFDETDVSLARILATNVEAALTRADGRRELARQHERLDEFASVVSHDLRNPLNVANGQLDLARKECDSDHLDEVADAHDRMQTLIDDLLTLAREGDSVVETEPVALRAIADTCWGTVPTDGATLVTDATRTVRADRGRLGQLLENLFRNAVEHGSTSPRSQVHEDVHQTSSDAAHQNAKRSEDAVEHGSTSNRPRDDGAVEHGSTDVRVTVGGLDDGFFVADDGPGIPESEHGDVFRRGYSTARENTGFGLAIVEQIAEAHGWNVRVTESADGGARFEITGVACVE